MKFANLQCEWAQVIRGLDALQQVNRSRHTPHAARDLLTVRAEEDVVAKAFWRFHKYLI
jgi:hypothetical protein